MTGKRDVREEMAEAAELYAADAAIREESIAINADRSAEFVRGFLRTTERIRLASRVLKHEAAAGTRVIYCRNCGDQWWNIGFGDIDSADWDSAVCRRTCPARLTDDEGEESVCGGTLTELIERYRGDDA